MTLRILDPITLHRLHSQFIHPSDDTVQGPVPRQPILIQSSSQPFGVSPEPSTDPRSPIDDTDALLSRPTTSLSSPSPLAVPRPQRTSPDGHIWSRSLTIYTNPSNSILLPTIHTKRLWRCLFQLEPLCRIQLQQSAPKSKKP